MRRRRRNGLGPFGYTLVELAIVVLILGILAAVAAPKYQGALALRRADAVSRRVAADLRLARNYARKTSQTQTVTFNAANETYAMSSMPNPDRPANIYSVSLAGSQYYGEVVSATFGGGPSVQFDIYGRPNNTGSVTVRSSGRQSVVQVDEAGTVSIQ